MPIRATSHVVADKAVTSVAQIIANSGFASEAVHHDYGEDLFVQTTHNSIVDPNRIWIQVKGTESVGRYRSKKHGLSLLIPEAHAMRWIRSSEMVVVVLWDVAARTGYWSRPIERISDWDVQMNESDTVRLVFDEASIFDSEAMLSIAWQARIDHYQGLVARAQIAELDLGDKVASTEKPFKSPITLICLDFLKLLDIVHPKGFNSEFWMRYSDMISRSAHASNRKKKSSNGWVAVVALLYRTEELAKHGLPSLLLSQCAHLITDLASNVFDPETGMLREET